jgi:putative membrane protein
MKRLDVATIAVAVAVALGCNVSPRDQASLETNQPEATGTAGMADTNDREFVERMAGAGMTEVQLGTLAKERAESPEVRQFAEMMIRDHSAAAEKLEQVARRYAIAMPAQIDEKHQELAHRLSTLRGDKFDRAYMRAMVDGHQEVIDLLQTRADEDRFGKDKGTVQPEQGDSPVEGSLNQWAARTLMTTRHHLDEAKRIHLSVENTFGPPAGYTPKSSSSRTRGPRPGQ